jgi:hypothetical protein
MTTFCLANIGVLHIEFSYLYIKSTFCYLAILKTTTISSFLSKISLIIRITIMRLYKLSKEFLKKLSFGSAPLTWWRLWVLMIHTQSLRWYLYSCWSVLGGDHQPGYPLEKYRIEFIKFHCVNLEELKNKWSPAVFPYLDVSEHWRKSLSWGGNVWKTGQRVQQDLSVAPVYLRTVGGGIAWSLKFL